MLLGVHVSSAGRIFETLERARALGCNTMQIFTRAPQRWRQNTLPDADIQEFRKRRSLYGISPVFVHIPYLINLASPEKKLYDTSIRATIEDVLEASSLGAEYLVLHMGSHKATSESAGIKRITAALNTVLSETKKVAVALLLENTSGAGSWLGYNFAHHRQIIQGIRRKSRVGVCLDTAHAYLAGYDLAHEEGFQQLFAEIDKEVGIDRVTLVHLNDAFGKLGSHHDRHAHIAKGSIGRDGLRRIVTDSRLAKSAFILETPKDTPDADQHNLEKVRQFVSKK